MPGIAARFTAEGRAVSPTRLALRRFYLVVKKSLVIAPNLQNFAGAVIGRECVKGVSICPGNSAAAAAS